MRPIHNVYMTLAIFIMVMLLAALYGYRTADAALVMNTIKLTSWSVTALLFIFALDNAFGAKTCQTN